MENLSDNALISTILIHYLSVLESKNTKNLENQIDKLNHKQKQKLINRLYDIQGCFS